MWHSLWRRRSEATAAMVCAAVLSTTDARSDVLLVPGEFATIQSAIDAASDGDEIIVAPGTYHEAIDLLGKAVALRSSGGAARTTMDAVGLRASVLTCVSGEGRDTVIDGFVLTGGTGTVIDATTSRGGGAYLFHSSPTLMNCTVRGNAASTGGGIYAGDSAAAILDCAIAQNEASSSAGLRSSGALTVTRCAFIANSASNGAGAASASAGLQPTGATFTDCLFDGNSAPASDGGVYAIDATFIGCTFQNHSTRALTLDSTSTSILNCTFRDNPGGALLLGGYDGQSTVIVSDSSFINNGASAIVNHGRMHLILTGCTFEGNTGTQGGALRHSCFGSNGFGFCPSSAISNCTFVGNTASENGGALATGCIIDAHANACSEVSIAQSVFSDNVAGSYGGAISNHCVPTVCGEMTVSGSTFTHNSASAGGGAIANLDESSGSMLGSILCQNAPEMIFGDWIDEGGNVIHGPADLTCDGSVNAADLAMVLGSWSVPPGSRGCAGESHCPADLNDDGLVNAADLALLLGVWTS